MKQTPFFEIVRLVDTDPDSMEELGTKPKYWFEFTDDTLQFPAGTEMLFKADNRGTGEDWAERIACELCNYLKIPHVEYEMAEESESGRYGVICPNCAISPNSLVLGNQLLLSKNPDYQEDFSHKYGAKKHTISAVTDILKVLSPPPPPWNRILPGGIVSAIDVFAGYLLLDTLIAN